MSGRVARAEGSDFLGLNVDYDSAPVVQEFIEDPTFVTGYFGPLGCGKTTAGAIKAWAYGQEYPGARIAVVRDTWPNLRDTTQQTFFDWFPDGVAGEYRRTTRTFFLRTPSEPIEVLFRAMDDKKDISNVLSLDLAAAWVDEPQGGLALRGESVTREPGIDQELFLSILARCGRQTGYPGLCWLTGNPPDPHHWIPRKFGYKGKGQPTNPDDDYRLYLGNQNTNRHNLPPRYYERLERLFGVGTPMARRFLKGEWIAFAQLNPFQAEWIAYWDERPPLEDLYVCVAIDPAISKRDEASKTAIVAIGQRLRGPDRITAYVLKAVAEHWTGYQQVAQLLKMVQEFGARKVRVEAIAYQQVLEEILRKEARVQGIRLPFVDAVKRKPDKILCAMAASPMVESGRVLFGPGQRDLVDALLSVPHDKAGWDFTDAFGLALGGLPKTRAEATPLEAPEHSEASRKRARSYAIPGPKDPTRPIPIRPGMGFPLLPGSGYGKEEAVRRSKKVGRSYGNPFRRREP